MDLEEEATVLKQPTAERGVLKRSMSTTALQAAQSLRTEFIHNIRSQIKLAQTGQAHDNSFDIERSLIVGLSCLPFLVISYQFFRVHCYFHGVQYFLQAFLSFQADCWNSKSKWYNTADRISATGVILLGPGRVILFPIAGTAFRLQAALLVAISLCVLSWSRKSKCMKEYAIRHTLWHVVGFLAVYLYADRVMYNRTYDPYWPYESQFWKFGA
ncbi:hypothetical protein HOP50_02g17250 [Chloropicon primus]|uniref:Uncharacterized protein n=1 Tax=Chloropicon primus TaxID=1764295 RepID=A0A5B8MIL7_9CHLO|nr:hypothetical protein A3770_02p17280 [Chloropicon primus]UPQ98419.1 hypothetical protein HOP50_02g17250 [Chloropicon primus]|eukprot:QDZ19210.1 hypothetical protein A3770_02p17280 [Chloropicon primus]